MDRVDLRFCEPSLMPPFANFAPAIENHLQNLIHRKHADDVFGRPAGSTVLHESTNGRRDTEHRLPASCRGTGACDGMGRGCLATGPTQHSPCEWTLIVAKIALVVEGNTTPGGRAKSYR